MKTVKEYMKKAVIYFSPDDTIFHAAKVFSENNISGAPVMKDGKLVGIVSESDIIKFLSKKLLPELKPFSNSSLMLLELLRQEVSFYKQLKEMFSVKIEKIMNKKVLTIKPDSSLIEAAEIITKHDIRRLPVVDEEGRLVGIISRTDLLKALSEL